MKIVLFVLLMLSLNARAQDSPKFNIPAEVSQGFIFQNYHNPQWYCVSINASPEYRAIKDRIHLSLNTMALFSDGLTNYYVGPGVAYTIFEKEDMYNIQLTVSALVGTRNKQLYGGGIKLESGDFFISVIGRQEYSKKQFYFSGGLGINIFQF